MTRRERLHAHTREEIKAVARQQMAAQGTAALSLAAIARQMELTTPALYRYFADRDALVTALIIDAFRSVADSMEAAAENLPHQQYAERLVAVMGAYRAWALRHPVDFQLIYGNPIPGYHAPADLTVPEVRRGAAVILTILQAAYDAGALQLSPGMAPPADILLRASDTWGAESALQPAVVFVCMTGWTRMHGIVMLELFNHLQPTIGDVGAFFHHELALFLRDIGLTPLNTS